MLLLALLACAPAAAPASAAHVACGDAIDRDTTLDSDLVGCQGDGLVITADDVTIDLAGHTLDGTGTGNGVSAERGVNRFTLVGGTIRGFHDGVYTDDPHATLRAMRLIDNVKYGVEAYGGGAFVRDSLVAGNEIGTWQANTDGSTFSGNSDVAVLYSEGVGTHTDNTVRRNGAGILVAEGDGTVARNVVTDNRGGGISWSFSGEGAIRDNFVARNGVGISVGTFAGPVIEGNTILRNRSHGIFGRWSDGFAGSLVVRNAVHGNGGHGIFTTGFDPCPQLRDNDVERNGGDGIFVESLGDQSECDSVPVTGNTASRNAQDGIHVSDNTGPVLVEGNRTDHNGDDGIDVDPQAAFSAPWNPLVTLTANAADHNRDLGIEAAAGVNDGGGNTARHNKDRRQCVGVACR